MEDALVQVKNYNGVTIEKSVLILVLMEDALVLRMKWMGKIILSVLILVLMEDALVLLKHLQ